MDMIFVILWKYNTGSGGGAVRAYTTREEAEQTMQLLADHGNTTKTFWIAEGRLVDA